MNRLYFNGPFGEAEVPLIRDPEELNERLTHDFLVPGANDACFTFHISEIQVIQYTPFVESLVDIIGQVTGYIPKPKSIAEHLEEGFINVFPKYRDLSTRLARSDEFGAGSSFVEVHEDYVFLLAPAFADEEVAAQASPGVAEKDLAIELATAVAADMSVIDAAMQLDGYEPIVIDYKPGPDFPAHRESSIGAWLLGKIRD